jgi:hypothetical protein
MKHQVFFEVAGPLSLFPSTPLPSPQTDGPSPGPAQQVSEEDGLSPGWVSSRWGCIEASGGHLGVKVARANWPLLGCILPFLDTA